MTFVWLTLLVVLAPWWIPLAWDILLDIWSAAGTGATRAPGTLLDPSERPRRGRPAPRRFSDEGVTWTRRPLINPRWYTGRRARGSGLSDRRSFDRTAPHRAGRGFRGG